MRKGSKSFSLAARLFAGPEREGAELLYAWCRFCDDAIDEAPTRETAGARLRELEFETRAALGVGAMAQASQAESEMAFQAFRELARRYNIPATYPLELLEGLRMDVELREIRTQKDLELYCYRVASVVGLMMVHVMGLSDPRALRSAVDMGMAMQMTNIARDIHDDFKMGRIYLPTEWFLEAGLRRPLLNAPFQPVDFLSSCERLLDQADTYYESGRNGLQALPLRAALAVGAAQAIYRQIGVLVRRRGALAWNQRAVVSKPLKIWLVLSSSLAVIASRIPQLIMTGRRWRAVTTLPVFTPSDL